MSPGVLHPCYFTIFSPPLPRTRGSLRADLMKASNLYSLSLHILSVSFCICTHLLLEEALLMRTRQGTDMIWEQQNIIKSHFIVCFYFAVVVVLCFVANNGVWFNPVIWAILSLIPGHPDSVGHRLSILVWVLSQTLVGHFHKFCVNIDPVYLTDSKDFSKRGCGCVGVQVSLSMACALPSWVRETRM